MPAYQSDSFQLLTLIVRCISMKISFIAKITLIIIPFLFFILPISIIEASVEVDVNRLIDGLQNRYGKMKGLAADFTQLYHDSSGRQLREQGTLLLKKPGKMRWEYRQPEQKLFLTDGKKVYFYVPAERQVTITTIKEADDPRIPFLFLLGRGDLRKDFTRIEISESESPARAGNVVLELVPKRANSNYKRIFVEVDPQGIQLYRLVFIDAAGARSDFLLSNYRENFLAGDDQFEFDPPAGVRVLK
jgi:outer membrane lipoprotein carrier protein